MTQNIRLCSWAVVVTFILLVNGQPVNAEFVSFGNFSQWEINQGDSGPAPLISTTNDSIMLTNAGSGSQRRSIFHRTPQDIETPFRASYVYTFGGSSPPQQQAGIAFVIQNSPSGFDALGGSGVELGYDGITKSLAVTLELNQSRTGFYFNGNKGNSFGQLSAPVILSSTNPILVEIDYDGGILKQTLTDAVTLDSYAMETLINIPSLVGSTTAFVGFTGSNGPAGFNSSRDQFISDPTFINVPEPSSLMAAATGGLALMAYAGHRKRRRRALHSQHSV